ncbi:MAG: sugar phosphate isomerase/epimerase [Asticcacaulis sp.]|nr:sugar phosphate isomerase/epimerase [Asticcacaulis sp.]
MALGAWSVAGCAPAQGGGRTDLWPMGVQLWTVNAELQKDAPGTLKALKDAGYEVVETAGTQGRTAAEFRTLVEAAGLIIRSAHTSMPDLIAMGDQKIADAVALGAEWLVASSPKPPAALDPAKDWVVAMGEAMTADAYAYNAEQISLLAPKVKAAGLKFAYHNHPMEFKELDSGKNGGGGKTGYDVLLSGAPADLLRLEMDIGWVAVSGQDPVAMMKKYADRLDLLHVKDVARDDGEPTGYRSVEVGNGMIDWKGVFEEAKAIGLKGYFVEQEAPYKKPVMTSLAESRAYLQKL